ncbi:MAG: hypothetical protein R2856_23005 [Caldilineaceae bacterium]
MLLIADEPTTAVDVTIQAQILALMKDLQKEMGMALMVITHDLAVISELCDRVMIKYLAKIGARLPANSSGQPQAPVHRRSAALGAGTRRRPRPGDCAHHRLGA